MKRRMTLALLVLVAGLAACATEPTATVRDKLIAFIAPMAMTAEGEVVIELGLYNGGTPVEADDAFEGRWELAGPEGALRAAGEIRGRPALPGGQETNIVTWTGRLEPGTYRLTWSAPDYGGTVIDFDVVQGETGLQLGSQKVYVTTDYPVTPES